MLATETEADYWFIEVKPIYDASGNYTFDVSVDSQNDAQSGRDVASSFQEAYEIGQGEHEGRLQDLDENDMYKIKLQPGSNIDFEFSSEAPNDGHRLKLYNPERNDVLNIESRDGSIDTGDYMLANETEADYWFIEVKPIYDASGNYTFDVSVDSQNDAQSGRDVASSFQEAYEIRQGEHKGRLQDLDESEKYKIKLQPGSNIDFEFSSEAPNDGHRLKLYNPDRNEVLSIESRDGSIDTGDYMLANETEADYWFIEVKPIYSAAGNYTFDVSVDSQNDAQSGRDVASSFQEAYEIRQGEHEGRLQDLDENDMYKIKLQPGSNIDFEFSSEAPNDGHRLKLYNPDRNDVANIESRDGSIDTGDYVVANDTETGNWFIEVKPIYSAAGDYTFDVSVDGQAADEFETANLRAVPSDENTGKETELRIDVKNVGEESGEYTVDFVVDGENIGSDTMTVESGETKVASVTYKGETTGNYTVEAGNQDTEITVKESASLLWLWILIAVLVLGIIIGLLTGRKKGNTKKSKKQKK